MITQNLLKELFDYQDGNLYWKESGIGRKIGMPAGTLQKSDYRSIQINGKKYLTHRLIFLQHHGYLPKFLDHIDGDLSNNSIDNLRKATGSQNNMNRKKNKSMNGKSTTSKFKGVYRLKRGKKWYVKITINGKNKYLGSFDSEIEAAKAYNKAAIELFGEFAKPNECQ